MPLFIMKRCLVGIGLVWVVLTVIFLVIHAVPGDPAEMLLSGGDSGQAISEEALERVRTQLGLNLPLHQQYFNYLAGIVTGDLGTSFRDGKAVMDTIVSRLPVSLELILAAAVIAVVAGVAIGAFAARRGGGIDSAVSLLTSLGIAVPSYVLGSLGVLVLSLWLGWVPAGGYTSWEQAPAQHLHKLVLPAVILSVSFMAVITRMTRSSVKEMQSQDWVRTARAHGLSRGAVFRKHVLRNSLTPIATTTGLEVGSLIGATILVERVFNYPGLSSALVEGVTNRDYPVVQGVVIVVSVLFIVINILVDVLYGVLDPRVRTQR